MLIERACTAPSASRLEGFRQFSPSGGNRQPCHSRGERVCWRKLADVLCVRVPFSTIEDLKLACQSLAREFIRENRKTDPVFPTLGTEAVVRESLLDKCLVEVSTIRNPYEANRAACRRSRVQQITVLQSDERSLTHRSGVGFMLILTVVLSLGSRTSSRRTRDHQITKPRPLGLAFQFNTSHSAGVFNNGNLSDLKSMKAALHFDRS